MESVDIKKAGLKVTLPRVKILEILEQRCDEHLTAEDIYRSLLDADEDIGLATVYRVLTQFEGVGLVRKHNFEGGQSVYELDRDGHHDHILCLDCGKIFEFVDEEIERRQHSIAEDKGFKLEEHSLTLYARCSRCPNKDGVQA